MSDREHNKLVERVARVMAARTPSPVSWMTAEEYVDRSWGQYAATASVIVALVQASPTLKREGGE